MTLYLLVIHTLKCVYNILKITHVSVQLTEFSKMNTSLPIAPESKDLALPTLRDPLPS